MNEINEEEYDKIVEFDMKPVFQRYYDEGSCYGVFNCRTDDNIPKYTERVDKDLFTGEIEKYKFCTLVGRMQALDIGVPYHVKAKCEFSSKYNDYQYSVISVTAVAPKTQEAQAIFLQTIVSKTVADNIIAKYPNVIEDVMSGVDNVDVKEVAGLGEVSWKHIKEKIVDNYIISDIITLLQPLGVTYGMIKTLLRHEPNPELLKQKLNDNPYILTRLHSFGFKRVDKLALKLKPDLLASKERLIAFITYTLSEDGETEGHTWIHLSSLKDAISNNCYECMEHLDEVLQMEKYLHVEDDRVGLTRFYNTEEKIFDILAYKTQNKITKFSFTDEEINAAISKAEQSQGFNYTDEQKQTVYGVLTHDVAVISGKAGVGKSSIALAIFNAYNSKGLAISACALSAKAAIRITEVTEGYEATTIHRMLKAHGNNEFEYNEDNPLYSSVFFIDESSMINAGLFYSILSAASKNTRIIMCGDNMQLPPIGWGNVFSDIIEQKDIFPVYELKTVMRQAEKSGILHDANMIREGRNPVTSPELKLCHGELHDMFYKFRTNRELMRNMAVKAYLDAVDKYGLDETVIIIPRKQDCINSVNEINNIIQEKLLGDVTQQITKPDGTVLKLGAKVINRKNNYDLNIFNGDTGFITKIYGKNGLATKNNIICTIDFGNNIIIDMTKSELINIDLAYAYTLHSVQGSGYKVVVGIVDNTHFKLLDNCMLYTMLTRAKKQFMLIAEPSAFLTCMRNNNNLARQTWFASIAERKKKDMNKYINFNN